MSMATFDTCAFMHATLSAHAAFLIMQEQQVKDFVMQLNF